MRRFIADKLKNLRVLLISVIIISSVSAAYGIGYFTAGHNTTMTIQQAINECETSYLNQVESEFVITITPGKYKCDGSENDDGNNEYAG